MKFLYLCEDALFLVKVGADVRGRFIEYHDVNAIHLMGVTSSCIRIGSAKPEPFPGM
jgi:hypothetical protein